MLLARSLLLDRPTGPLPATLRIACAQTYFIEVNGQQLQTRASLVAPKAERKRISAVDSDVALFYLPLDMTEYAGVRAVFGEHSMVELPIDIFELYVPRLQRATREVVSALEIKCLVTQIVAAMTRLAPPSSALPTSPALSSGVVQSPGGGLRKPMSTEQQRYIEIHRRKFL